MYDENVFNPMTNPVTPIPEVKAPSGYGLDNRFNQHYKGLKILNVHVWWG